MHWKGCTVTAPLSLRGSGSELVLPSIPGSGTSPGIHTEMQPNTEQHTHYTAARCNGDCESLIIAQRCPLPAGPGSFLRYYPPLQSLGTQEVLSALASMFHAVCGLLMEIQSLWMYQVPFCAPERGFGHKPWMGT